MYTTKMRLQHALAGHEESMVDKAKLENETARSTIEDLRGEIESLSQSKEDAEDFADTEIIDRLKYTFDLKSK